MKNWRKMIGYLCLVLIAISMLYPFFAMINLSFVPNGEIFNQGGKLFYSPLTLENYSNVFEKIPMWKYFVNSLFVAIVTTFGQVLFSALAGYAFARLTFKFRDALFLIILITMLVPPQVNIIPLFFLMRQLEWINTYQALILPGLFGNISMTFFLVTYMKEGIPDALIESAKIDGSSHFKMFFDLALPLSKPAIAAQAIFWFVGIWNDYFAPSIYLTKNVKTLQVYLNSLISSNASGIEFPVIMAGSVLASIPMMIIFFVFQNFFSNSIALSGMKE